MTFLETGRIMSGSRLALKALSCAVIIASALLCHSLPVSGSALAQTAQSYEQDDVSDKAANPYADFLRRYVDWANRIEIEGQRSGLPLSGKQIELAKQIGIKHPEKVRLVFVDKVPFPDDDEDMRKVGEALGFIGPGVINNAQAFGYTIWVRNGYTLDRPKLAHELVHVQQIERSGNFGEFVFQYMMQLREHGHYDMPLEIEAYAANEEYKSHTHK